ncbi:coiled-coil domain-containing protein 65 [Lasius niger]|uniref:Coiled-coil domain-containing protein 65 n=1 Tax=Lasius niger TaxID=67767 RepID=A0A0J7KI66_LASNI|nr:coiled-coil domain-containing protein 65 [Lasius niger]
MLRMQAVTNVMLRDVKQRLTKVEDVLKNRSLHLPESNGLIAQFLPLNTINDVKEFESVLKITEEAVTQFRQFVSKTGGNNPRHTIQRTLQKIFTNECAMKCSWKGIKNNFRVSDLYLIKIMKKDVTLQHKNLTESEFDNIVAEWLRFARQRKKREDKEKENEHHNENEEPVNKR